MTNKPILPVEVATDVASSAFNNDDYNEDVFDVMDAFHERDAKERASRSGSSGSAVPSGCELGCEAFPDVDTSDSNYESDHLSVGGELNRSASLGDSDTPKAKQPFESLLLNTTQAGSGAAIPVTIASRPSAQPSVAASMPIGISGIVRLPSIGQRPRLASRQNPNEDSVARFDNVDEVETDDENDSVELPTGVANASGRPRRLEEMRRNLRKAREEAPATLTEQSQAQEAASDARQARLMKQALARSMLDRDAYYGAGVGERPDSTSYARLCGGQFRLNSQAQSQTQTQSQSQSQRVTPGAGNNESTDH